MAKGTLVGIDIERGERLLSVLDKAGFPVTVALWLLNEEFGEWQLVLSSPIYDKSGPKTAYLQLQEAVSASDPELMYELPVTLRGNRNTLIRNLRKLFAKSVSVEGMRLGGQSVGGVWIEDAHVYRIR